VKPVLIGLADWRLPVSGPDAVRLAARAGAEGIQLDLGGPGKAPWLDSTGRLQTLSTVLAETGVKPLAVSANLLNDIGLAAEKGTLASKNVRNVIRRALDVAVTLRASLVFLPSFRNSAIESLSVLARTAEVLQWACSEASKRGLLLATENVLDSKQLQQLIASVDATNLRVILDTGNPLAAGLSPVEVVRVAAPVLAQQVHIKSADDKKQLSNDEAAVLETFEELESRHIPVEAFVLENDYRDGVHARLKTDILWLKKYISRFRNNLDLSSGLNKSSQIILNDAIKETRLKYFSQG